MRLTMRLVVALLLAAVAAPAVFAHAIKATVTVTAAEVQVRVSFDGEDDLRGKVTVRLEVAETKEKLGQAEPDKGGVCSFPRPKPGRYRVVAEDDGFGHRCERTFDVTDGAEETVPALPEQPRGLMIVVGLGVIAGVTLVCYWLASRKKG